MFETTRRHIFLAGFMGTGKTAVGRALADRLGWGFIDLDEMIESACHRSIPDIFRLDGEEAFRNYESRALRLAVISPHSVIAIGGGTPLRKDNANVIRATGRTWLLTATWEVIWRRVSADLNARPVFAQLARELGGSQPTLEQFAAFAAPILERRAEAYRVVADHTLDTSKSPVDELTENIMKAVVS